MLKLVNATTYVNTDAVDLLQENGDGTYKVTLRSGTIFASVSLTVIQTVFPELTPPPPPPPKPAQGGKPQ